MGQELHIDLNTFLTDLQVPRAENKIRFMKAIFRCIQSEPPFTKYLKRLTTGVVKHATIFINLLNRKSGVYPVMSRRQKNLSCPFKKEYPDLSVQMWSVNTTSTSST